MIHGRRNGKMPSGQCLGRIRHFIQRTELFADLIQRIDVCSPMKRIRHQYAIGPLIRRCPAESPMIGTHAVTPELKATVAVVDRSGQQWVTDTQTIMLPRLIKEIIVVIVTSTHLHTWKSRSRKTFVSVIQNRTRLVFRGQSFPKQCMGKVISNPKCPSFQRPYWRNICEWSSKKCS